MRCCSFDVEYHILIGNSDGDKGTRATTRSMEDKPNESKNKEHSAGNSTLSAIPNQRKEHNGEKIYALNSKTIKISTAEVVGERYILGIDTRRRQS